jgi:hypothetical protein
MRVCIFINIRGLGPHSFSRMNVNMSPPKLDPPPVQPTMTSGTSPSAASCCMHSSPMTVWWSRTWLSTLPRQFGGGHLHRLGDGDVEAAQAGWVHRQDPPSDLRRLTKDSALPHCPASISVTTFFMPVAALYHTCGTSVFGLCVAERVGTCAWKRRRERSDGYSCWVKEVRERRAWGQV